MLAKRGNGSKGLTFFSHNDKDFDFRYLIFTVSYILNHDEGDSSLEVGCLLKISIHPNPHFTIKTSFAGNSDFLTFKIPCLHLRMLP